MSITRDEFALVDGVFSAKAFPALRKAVTAEIVSKTANGRKLHPAIVDIGLNADKLEFVADKSNRRFKIWATSNDGKLKYEVGAFVNEDKATCKQRPLILTFQQHAREKR